MVMNEGARVENRTRTPSGGVPTVTEHAAGLCSYGLDGAAAGTRWTAVMT